MIKSKLTTADFKNYMIKSIQNYVINAKDNPKKSDTYRALAKEDHLILSLVLKSKINLAPFNQELDRGHWQSALKLLFLENK